MGIDTKPIISDPEWGFGDMSQRLRYKRTGSINTRLSLLKGIRILFEECSLQEAKTKLNKAIEDGIYEEVEDEIRNSNTQ